MASQHETADLLSFSPTAEEGLWNHLDTRFLVQEPSDSEVASTAFAAGLIGAYCLNNPEDGHTLFMQRRTVVLELIQSFPDLEDG